MVPLRAVGDALGLKVEWNDAKREASFTDGTKTLYFPIDSATAHTDGGEEIKMDTAAVIVNDRTYAPVRYLAEFFGHTVEWDGKTSTVVIK
jgi:N-acetylmuramoyl-L-alanine amidase